MLSRTPRAGEAYALILMAVRALLPRLDAKETPLVEMAAELERVFYSKQASLAAAAGEPGATASSIMSALIRETGALRGAAAAAAAGTGAPSLGGSAIGAGGGDAIEEALSSAAYVNFKTTLAACDLQSATGRRAGFEAASTSDCVLTTRMLLFGEVALSKRHEALDTLLRLRVFLSEWFTYNVAADENGETPLALARWSVTGRNGAQTAFIDGFMKMELSTMNWMGSHAEPGLLHYRSALESRKIAAPHPADHLCDPALLILLADFGQSLFSGLGYPAAPTPPSAAEPAGYSWKTFWDFYNSVVKVARTLPHREAQLDWLDECHDLGVAALKLMQQLVLSELKATEGLRDRCLNALLPFDCQPAERLRVKFQHFGEDQVWVQRVRPFGRGSGSSETIHNIHDTPLRSWRHKKRPLDAKPKLRGGKQKLTDDAVEAAPLEGPNETIDDHARGGDDRKDDRKPALLTTWIKANELLFVSGLVWEIKPLAAKLKISPIDAKCWPFLLSRKQQANRLKLDCPKHAAGTSPLPAAHAAADSAAHVIKDFDPADYLAEFSRYPTADELTLVKAASAAQGSTVGNRGRGGRARGRSFQRPGRA